MKIINSSIILFFVSLNTFSNLLAESDTWPHSYGMNTAQIEDFLKTAVITFSEKTKLGITKPQRITLEKNNIKLRAVFKTFSSIKKRNAKSWLINSADSYKYDLTAYKLNKLLGLNMVPVTVERAVGGRDGVVIFWIENALVYKFIYPDKLKQLDICPYKKQHSIMYVFDILIFNDDRNMGNLLYTLADCRLWMIDHSRAFRIINRISKNLPKKKIRLSKELAQKLGQLTKQKLEEHISETLNETQIIYILKRRDLILQKWEANGKPGFISG